MFYKKKKKKIDYYLVFVFGGNMAGLCITNSFSNLICCYQINAFKRVDINCKNIAKYKKIFVFSKI